jgi:hypothetical protein
MCEDMELVEMHAMTVERYDMNLSAPYQICKPISCSQQHHNFQPTQKLWHSFLLAALAKAWAAACSSSEPATVLIARGKRDAS